MLSGPDFIRGLRNLLAANTDFLDELALCLGTEIAPGRFFGSYLLEGLQRYIADTNERDLCYDLLGRVGFDSPVPPAPDPNRTADYTVFLCYTPRRCFDDKMGRVLYTVPNYIRSFSDSLEKQLKKSDASAAICGTSCRTIRSPFEDLANVPPNLKNVVFVVFHPTDSVDDERQKSYEAELQQIRRFVEKRLTDAGRDFDATRIPIAVVTPNNPKNAFNPAEFGGTIPFKTIRYDAGDNMAEAVESLGEFIQTQRQIMRGVPVRIAPPSSPVVGQHSGRGASDPRQVFVVHDEDQDALPTHIGERFERCGFAFRVAEPVDDPEWFTKTFRQSQILCAVYRPDLKRWARRQFELIFEYRTDLRKDDPIDFVICGVLPPSYARPGGFGDPRVRIHFALVDEQGNDDPENGLARVLEAL